jgi:hypothetical protein
MFDIGASLLRGHPLATEKGGYYVTMEATWQALLKPGQAENFFEADPLPPWQVQSPESFSKANAWWLSELSRLIYRRDRGEAGATKSGPRREEILQAVGLHEHRFFDIDGSQAAIVVSGPTHPQRFAVVVFRGTRGTLGSWLRNFDVLPAPWPGGGRVHRGFLRRFEALWPPIAAELDGLNRPFWVTGHSLGAALAVLAAARRRPLAAYTYGSPRVGDGRFAAGLSGIPIFRICNPADIVTIIPLWLHHAGHPGGGRCIVPADAASSRTGSSCLLKHPPSFLSQHAPLNYTSLWTPSASRSIV